MQPRARILFFILLLFSLAAAFAGDARAGGGPVFLYVHDNGQPNRVFAYRLGSRGTLAAVSGSPFTALGNGSGACSGQCQTVAYSGRRHLLFVSGGDGLSVFRVLRTGALAPLSATAFGGSRMVGVAVVERRRSTYVYGADAEAGTLRGFEVQRDGTLAELPASPFAAAPQPLGISAGEDLLAAATAAGIVTYRIEVDGTLTPAPGAPFSTGASTVTNVNIEPRGQFVYANDGDQRGAGVFGFAVDRETAALAPLTGSPFAVEGDIGGSGLALGAGRFLFALGPNGIRSADIQVLRRENNGRLTGLPPARFSGLSRVRGGALDPSGQVLAVVDDEANQVRTFRIGRRDADLTVADARIAPLGDGQVSGILFVKR